MSDESSHNEEKMPDFRGDEKNKILAQQTTRKRIKTESPLSPALNLVKRKHHPLFLSLESPTPDGDILLNSSALNSPTDTVQTADTCPLDLEASDDDIMIHDDDEISVSHGDTQDPLAVMRATRTARRFRHWKAHSHAVGLAPLSWMDEKEELMTARSTTVASDTEDETSLDLSLMFCGHFQRVGNMVILKERNDWIQLPTRDDNAMILPQDIEASLSTTGSTNIHSARRTETRFTIVLGPYWATLFGFTLPFITALSTLTGAVFIPPNLKSDLPSGCWIISIWSVATIGLYLSLLYTSMVDPGILPRHNERPSKSWRWNDQAQSYIPPDAVYEPDCKVVIEGYHHTCIYTGTAIGKNNSRSFLMFMILGFTCLFMDSVLLVVFM